jgi:hypothetical protein
MTWEYMGAFDVGVPLAMIDPADGAQKEYVMELPRFLLAESLFRPKGKTRDGQPMVVEWACIEGKRRLVSTRAEGIGTIDDWASPSRIIPVDEFTDEIIERGGLLAEVKVENAEDKDEVCQWCEDFRCACDYEDEPSECAETEMQWYETIVPESSSDEPTVETESDSDTEESDIVEMRFEDLTLHVDEIVEAYNDEAVAFFAPKLRYQRFLSDMMTVIVEYEDVFAWLTQQIQTEAESERPDDQPVRPQVQPYVAETISRPANKPMALPKPKQRAMQWT